MTTGGNDETIDAAIDRHLAGLSPATRDALGYLCVFEPVSRTDLVALTDESSVQEAIEAGVAADHDSVIYSGQPLFLERLATTLDRDEIARRRSALASRLAGRPAHSPAERLSRTLLALQGAGDVDTDAAVFAAQEALRLGDLGLAERLAGGTLEHAERLDARLALSYALAWQGLIALHEQGLVRAIGMSNFTPAHLARIERLNPKLNAIVTLVAERAMADAARSFRDHRAIEHERFEPCLLGLQLRGPGLHLLDYPAGFHAPVVGRRTLLDRDSLVLGFRVDQL